jgi:8-oxo-dGTP pyrophosphatase MutT (NUDIX family)
VPVLRRARTSVCCGASPRASSPSASAAAKRRAPGERARQLAGQRVDAFGHRARRVQLEHAAPFPVGERRVLERHGGDRISACALRAKERRVDYRARVPVVPVPAATVILLRDSDAGPEVLLLARHARSEFLPDMYVFPGGRVEDEDHLLAERVAGLSRAAASARLGTVPAEQALGFFVAGVRETYEESGILLARRRGSSELLDAASAEALSRHRLAVQQGEASFRDLVLGEDLVLAAELLSVHAHWITPEDSPRRFDTIFFAAVTPPGQAALHDGVELTDHVWLRPEQGLAEFRAGRRQMIIPTWANLETLSGFASAAATLAASRARPIVPILPVVVERDGVRAVVIPENAGYPTTEERIGEARG